MDKRKVFGTILGSVAFIAFILVISYAFYVWRSEETEVSINLSDSYFYCESGIENSASGLSPVSNYKQGSAYSFKVNNIGNSAAGSSFSISMKIKENNTVSNFFDESFKYVIMADTTGGNNNCTTSSNCTEVATGNFKNFKIGMNTLAENVTIPNDSRYEYYLFLYIDGNMQNPTAMQTSTLEFTLDVCEIVAFLDYNGGNVGKEFVKIIGDTYGETNPLIPTTPTKSSTTINYNSNGGSSVNASTINYTFGGWYKDEGTWNSKIESTTPINTTLNHTLYAKWNVSSITLPTAPTRTGYTFKGWKDEGGTVYNASSSYTLPYNTTKTSVTLTAQWQANNYTITLNGNGATTSGTTSVTATYDSSTINPSSITLPQRKYTVSGFATADSRKSTGATISSTASLTSTYTFNGWNTTSTGGSKVLSNTTTPTFNNVEGYTESGKWKRASNTTLYANWTSKAVTLPEITKTGHTCGWTTNSSGATVEHASKASFTPTANTTLYAVCVPNKYTVTYDCATNGGTTATTTAEVTYGTAVDLTKTCTKSGYSFVGWNTNKDATSKLSSYTMPANAVTLYGIFSKEVTVTATFDKNGGSANTSATAKTTLYNKNTSIDTSLTFTAPACTTYSGWNCIGYNTSSSSTTSGWNVGSTKSIAVKGTVAESSNTLTISSGYYHIWKKTVSVTVTFDKNSGSANTTSAAVSKTLYNGATSLGSMTFTAPSCTTRTGYSCLGYNTSSSATSSGWNVGETKSITVSGTVASSATTYSVASGYYHIWEAIVTPSVPTYTAFHPEYSNKAYVQGNWTNKQVNTTLTTTYSGSYPVSMQYTLTSNESNGTIAENAWSTFGFSAGTLTKSGTTYTGTEPWGLRDRDNEYYFRACVTVNSQLYCSGKSSKYRIKYDLLAPKTSDVTYTAFHPNNNNATYTSGTWTNKQVYTTISAKDDATSGVGYSDIAYIQYRNQNSTSWATFNFAISNLAKSGTTWSGTESWGMTNGRNDYFYFRACDSVVDPDGTPNCSAEPPNPVYNIRYDTEKPSATITRSDYNTFSWTASDNVGVTGYAITTSNSTPSSWTTTGTLTSGTYDISAAGTYYVWAKDGAGNISTAASIKAYTISRSQGTGSTLTTRYDSTSSSTGTVFTSNTVVLHGTPIWASATANSGYNTPTLKHGSTTMTASGGTFNASATETITSSATLNTYTLTVTSGTGGSVKVEDTTKSTSVTAASGENKTLTVSHGDTIKVTATPNTGYNLSTLKHGSTSMSSGGTFTASGAETVAATWNPTTYTVEFYDNKNYVYIANQTLVTLDGRSYYKKSGASYPALLGMYYDGTYTGPLLVGTTANSVAYYTSADTSLTHTSSGSFTLDGVTWYYSSTEYWMTGNLDNAFTELGDVPKYTASADGSLENAAKKLVAAQTKSGTQSLNYGTSQALTKYANLSNKPTRTRHDFIGWNTKPDGTGTTYTDGQSVTNLASAGGTIKLYALWDPYSVNIVYNVNGGTIQTSTTTADGSTTYTWSSDANGDIYKAGNKNFHADHYANGSINLANWNNVNYMNIIKENYAGKDTAEWKCSSVINSDGTTGSCVNATYDHNSNYVGSDFCNASEGDCTVVLKVNWVAAHYSINYDPVVYAETLQEAIGAAVAGKTITLLNNYTDTSSASFSRNTTFNTGGYTLTRSAAITINSGVTVTKNGSGTINSSAVVFTVAGKLIHSAGTLNSTGNHTIYTSGTTGRVQISGGTVNNNSSGSHYAIRNASTYKSTATDKDTNIATDSTAVGTNPCRASGDCAVYISSGTIGGSKLGIFNDQAVDIAIKGGTINPTGGYGVYHSGTGTVFITGGTITTTADVQVLRNAGTGDIEMTGGTINCSKVTTGTCTRNNSTGIIGYYGGTITAAGCAIYNASTGSLEIGLSGYTMKVSSTCKECSTLYCGSTSGSNALCRLFSGATISATTGRAVSNYNASFKAYAGTTFKCTSDGNMACIYNRGTTYTEGAHKFGQIYFQAGYAQSVDVTIKSDVKSIEGVVIGRTTTDALYSMANYKANSYKVNIALGPMIRSSSTYGITITNKSDTIRWRLRNGMVGGKSTLSAPSDADPAQRSGYTQHNAAPSKADGYRYYYLTAPTS